LESTFKSGNSQAETKSKWQFIEMLRKDKKKLGCAEDKKIDSNPLSAPKKSKHSFESKFLETAADQNQDSDI
jgi:hypothetical protein